MIALNYQISFAEERQVGEIGCALGQEAEERGELGRGCVEYAVELVLWT